MSQYFENDAEVISSPVDVICWAGTKKLVLSTDSGVFSKGEIDDASAILVKQVRETEGRLLDLGCGYGFIGAYLKTVKQQFKVVCSDVNERAIDLCVNNLKRNNIDAQCIVSNGFEKIQGTFDVIVLNPPIHAGKEVCSMLYSDSMARLNEKGALYIVIRKKHGAESTKDKLREIGYNIEIVYKEKGIFVFRCTK